jgi:hypothetical protein
MSEPKENPTGEPPKLDQLLPGDVLLYQGKGLMSRLIMIKTWSHFSHCEIFDSYDRELGNAVSLASRDGIGVDRFVFRERGLMAILRPAAPPALDMERGRKWFREGDGGPVPKGQKYDWLGLWSFYNAKRQGSKKPEMFCSEFVVRYFKKSGYQLFFGDSDAVSPGMLWTNPLLKTVWAHPSLPVRDLEW